MKIHHNKEFHCFETTEQQKTDIIELDGVRLIPITEIEQIKAEIEEYMIISFCEDDDFKNIRKIINSHISELKGE